MLVRGRDGHHRPRTTAWARPGATSARTSRSDDVPLGALARNCWATAVPLSVGGDWAAGGRIESAYLSGVALADGVVPR